VAGKENLLIFRLTFVLLILAVSAPAARDPKLAVLESRVTAQDKTITELRTELALARASVQNRIDTALSGLEFKVAALEGELDRAHAETVAAQTAINGRDQTIRALNTQLDQARARATDSSTAAVADAVMAAKVAVKVATTRHASDAAEFKSASTLASSAAASASQAVDLGESNSRALRAALREIERLTAIIAALTRSEVVGRRLMVIVAVLIVLLFAVVIARFRR
jgi:uncharacterized coiled-coil protein SlyX